MGGGGGICIDALIYWQRMINLHFMHQQKSLSWSKMFKNVQNWRGDKRHRWHILWVRIYAIGESLNCCKIMNGFALVGSNFRKVSLSERQFWHATPVGWLHEYSVLTANLEKRGYRSLETRFLWTDSSGTRAKMQTKILKAILKTF